MVPTCAPNESRRESYAASNSAATDAPLHLRVPLAACVVAMVLEVAARVRTGRTGALGEDAWAALSRGIESGREPRGHLGGAREARRVGGTKAGYGCGG